MSEISNRNLWHMICVITLCSLLVVGLQQMKLDKLKTQAVKLGHAQYNPTTANFEWIEKEREE